MLSDLTSSFDESPETYVLKSLNTSIKQKNSNHHDWCRIAEPNFSTIIVQIP